MSVWMTMANVYSTIISTGCSPTDCEVLTADMNPTSVDFC